jgi:LysM repeat protein
MDWNKIKTEYVTSGMSYRKLSAKYGVNATVLAQRAKREDWVGLKAQYQSKTQTKVLAAIANKQVNRASRLQTVADKLLAKVEQLIDDPDANWRDTEVMRDVSRILKDLKDVQMIKSPEDIAEQEARIANLRKMAEKDESKNEPIQVSMEEELEDYSA